MSLPALSIRRPVTTVMLTLIVIILGVISLTNLKQELMPEINLGVAIVVASYDGAGPEEVETLVTKPLETALSTVNNLQDITTTSAAGTSLLILEFTDGTDMDFAALRMRENIDMFRRMLPDGVQPRVLQIDPNMMTSFSIGVTGDYDLVTLKNLVDDHVVLRLEKLDGVGTVNVSGGMDREISVEMYPDKLNNYGITAQQIAGVLASENINRPGGTLVQGELELQVRTTGEFKSVAEISNLPLTTARGASIRLSDVAKVSDGYKEISSYSIINGRQGVTLSVSKQSIANTVDVSDRIVEELNRLRRDFPDLDFIVISDTADFIRSSISNVWTTVFQATALAMVVLLFFLGNFRSPLIIAVSIPTSIIASMALMYFTNMTLNMVTLNAIVISVGILIDNAIVVLESITRYVNQGLDPKEAAKKGSKEVSMAVTVSTLTTLAVFVPVLFVSGIAGEMFGQLGLIICFTLISSLVVSMTFVPMACSRFLRKRDDNKISQNPVRRVWERWDSSYERFRAWYGGILKWALGHKKVVFCVFLVFLLGTGVVIGFMGMDFMTEMDQGIIGISISTPRGSLLDEVSEATETVLARISDMDAIKDLSVTVGSGGVMGMLFGSSGANGASVNITLAPKSERPQINDVMEEMRERIGFIPGVEYTVRSASDMMAGGSGNSVSFALFGDNVDELAETGSDVVHLISTIPSIRNATTSLQDSYPQAHVSVDRQRANYHGLQASAVASTVNMAISGTTVTKFRVDGSEVDVVMRYEKERLSYIADLHNLMLMTPRGISIPLSEIAEIYEEDSPTTISKQNGRRYITISAEFVDTDLNSVSGEIKSLLEVYDFPEGMSYEFTGMYEMMMDSFQSLAIALLLGFVLLYMVMASQFESIAYPATILLSIPIAWTAGLFGIFLMGDSISVVSFIGLILLMGIVINNGIMMVDLINRKRNEGLTTHDAILFAAPVRLRPILMTTLSTVLGLMPLMFAASEGAEMQWPLGSVVIFGLSFSTLITLFLIPVSYMTLHNIRKRLRLKGHGLGVASAEAN